MLTGAVGDSDGVQHGMAGRRPALSEPHSWPGLERVLRPRVSAHEQSGTGSFLTAWPPPGLLRLLTQKPMHQSPGGPANRAEAEWILLM